MPALTNNRLGSSSGSEALGTTVWLRCSKCAMKRRRISAVSIGSVLMPSSCESGLLRGAPLRQCRYDGAQVSCRKRELRAQLGLLLGHARRYFRAERAEASCHGDRASSDAV